MNGSQITEGADAASSSATTYSMLPGDTFSGFLDAGDQDWIAITFEAGKTYEISLGGLQSGTGTLFDTDLRLYDGNGSFIEYDDLDGPGWDAQIEFTATSSGTYYIEADAYTLTDSGTYQLSVVEIAPPAPASVGTLDELANFLTGGYWQSVGFSGFQFNTTSSNIITVNITALTAEGQQLARWAMEAWEAVADIQFAEVTGGAKITFDDNQSGAFAGPNGVVGGYATDAIVNVGTGWLNQYGTTIDSYSFQTYVHEIGHALGLGHQGAYNGSASYGSDETFTNDSWQLSVMSYFSQTENTTVSGNYALVMSAMMADIIAIQNLYGASDVTAGATTWGQGSNFGTYLDDLMDFYVTGSSSSTVSGQFATAFTIYDYGGIDTLNLSFASASRLDLRDAKISDVNGVVGNVAIARGTIIENAILGSGNDSITGNNANNEISAGAGNDEIWALLGNDTVIGGAGNDTIGGAAGNDSLVGEDGDDQLWGAGGMDTLIGGDGDDTLGGGFWDDSLDGGAGADSLSGGTGLDTIYGGDGNDSIDGWAHIDEIHGGGGNDYILGGNWGDTIYGDAGNDLIFGDGDTNIPNNFTGADVIYGGTGNDTIVGGTGADTLLGEDGDDTIWGGDGWNVLNGGVGNDRIIGGNQTDRIIGGDGFDLLTGNGSADHFVFTTGTNTDRITDFNLAQNDVLELDDALWLSSHGALSAAQVVSTFGQVGASGHLELIFDGGERIILQGLTDSTGLDTAIDIF